MESNTPFPSKWMTILSWLLSPLPCLLVVGLRVLASFQPDEDVSLASIISGIELYWLFVTVFFTFLAFWTRRFKPFLPLIFSYLLLWQIPTALEQQHLEDYCRLAANDATYEAEIRQSPHTRHTFQWGSEGWAAGATIIKTLVYDPQDTLPAENEKKDAKLKRKFHYGQGKDLYYGSRIFTQRLWGHFYLVEEMEQA